VQDLNAALKRFFTFIRNVKFDSEVDPKSLFQLSTVVLSRGEASVWLTGDDADEYNDAVEGLYQGVIAKGHLSRAAVGTLAGNYLVNFFFGGNDPRTLPDFEVALEQAKRSLKRDLTAEPHVWEIQLVVEGLAPSGLPARVGGVDFYFCGTEERQSLSQRLVDMASPDISQPGSISAWVSAELERLADKAIARLEVTTIDFEAAYQMAVKKVRSTVDAINFYLSREREGGWIFLPGEASPSADLVIGIADSRECKIASRRHGPARKIPLKQLASRPGFSRISDLLSRPAPTDLEERILAALQWAGRAQVDPRREEAFLLFAISLETLMLGRDTTGEITHKLGVRCAHLGGGSTLVEKRRVIDQIAQLYRLRSKIVHSGSSQVAEAELALMKEYALISLFIVLDREPFKSMATVEQFDQWCEAQLLAGGLVHSAS
jgi:hypothetical protein